LFRRSWPAWTVLPLVTVAGFPYRAASAQRAAVQAAAVATRASALDDGGWGAPDGGVPIRARSSKRAWQYGETPVLQLDLTDGKGGLALRNFPYCEAEVDRIWYAPIVKGLVAGACVLPQASHLERFAAVRLDSKLWRLKSDGKTPLRLTA